MASRSRSGPTDRRASCRGGESTVIVQGRRRRGGLGKGSTAAHLARARPGSLPRRGLGEAPRARCKVGSSDLFSNTVGLLCCFSLLLSRHQLRPLLRSRRPAWMTGSPLSSARANVDRPKRRRQRRETTSWPGRWARFAPSRPVPIATRKVAPAAEEGAVARAVGAARVEALHRGATLEECATRGRLSCAMHLG